jgi:pilus assembly protein CpaB
MSSRYLGLILFALLLAFAAAWLAKLWIQTQAQTASLGPATVSCVVAVYDIGYAEKIKPQQVALEQCTRAALPRGTYDKVEDVVGKYALRSFIAGDPISRDRITENLSGSLLSAMIQEGMRAITVRVDDVAGGAGFILPGNRVDLLVMWPDGKARTLLGNLKVLAIDQEASPEKARPIVPRALTLEVTPQQAEMIAAAARTGPLHFTLRNPRDERESTPEPETATAMPSRNEERKARDSVLPPITVFRWTEEGGQIEKCENKDENESTCPDVLEPN